MQSRFPRLLRLTLRIIAIVQLILGAAFLLAPEQTARLLGLSPAPGWAYWLLGMMAARFLGYAFGLWAAASDPAGNRAWITTMLVIQLLDWLVTLKYVYLGQVTLAQVSTASFLPLVFVTALLLSLPRKSTQAVSAR